MDQSPEISPQQESRPPISQPTFEPQPSDVNTASRTFKIAFGVVALVSAGLSIPMLISLSSADGFGAIGIFFGWVLLWGFSILALLLTVFLRNLLPNRLISVIYGGATGAIMIVSLSILIIALTAIGPGPTRSIEERLFGPAVYVLMTLPIVLFVRYANRVATQTTTTGVHYLKNIGLISLVLGLLFSLGASGLGYLYIDRPRSQGPEWIEYEKCLERSGSGEYNSEECTVPNYPRYKDGSLPPEVGFPLHMSGDDTIFSLLVFMIIPNWLIWSTAVYLLMSLWYWFKSRGNQGVVKVTQSL